MPNPIATLVQDNIQDFLYTYFKREYSGLYNLPNYGSVVNMTDGMPRLALPTTHIMPQNRKLWVDFGRTLAPFETTMIDFMIRCQLKAQLRLDDHLSDKVVRIIVAFSRDSWAHRQHTRLVREKRWADLATLFAEDYRLIMATANLRRSPDAAANRDNCEKFTDCLRWVGAAAEQYFQRIDGPGEFKLHGIRSRARLALQKLLLEGQAETRRRRLLAFGRHAFLELYGRVRSTWRDVEDLLEEEGAGVFALPTYSRSEVLPTYSGLELLPPYMEIDSD